MAKRSDSASVVLPEPLCPTRATLRTPARVTARPQSPPRITIGSAPITAATDLDRPLRFVSSCLPCRFRLSHPGGPLHIPPNDKDHRPGGALHKPSHHILGPGALGGNRWLPYRRPGPGAGRPPVRRVRGGHGVFLADNDRSRRGHRGPSGSGGSLPLKRRARNVGGGAQLNGPGRQEW